MYKPLQKNIDLKAIETYTKFGTITAIVPCELRYLLIIQFGKTSAFTIFGVILFVYGLLQDQGTQAKIFFTSKGVMIAVINIIYSYGLIKKRKCWNDVMTALHVIDKRIGEVNISKYDVITKICTYTFSIFITLNIAFAINIVFGSKWFAIILNTIFLSEILYMDILIIEIVKFLKIRVVEARNSLKSIRASGDLYRDDTIITIHTIIDIYKDAASAIKNFNKFFDNLLLYRLTLNFVTILISCEYLLNLFYTKVTFVTFNIFAPGYLTLQLCFVVRCIISCENVQKAGEKLGTLCQILQSEVHEPRLKEQLADMSTLIQALPLSFSISGFFKINKSLIPGIISGITSYLIILIQFKAQEQCGSPNT